MAVTAVALLWGCEQRQNENSEERATISDLQQRSEDSLERAQQAQEKATAEQQDMRDAREDISEQRAEVQSAQKELETAEQRAAREAQEAREAQQQAASVSQSAQQEAATAQQTAQELQQQQSAQTQQQDAQTEVGVGGSGPTQPTAEQATPPAATETRPFTGDQANIAGQVESVGEGSLVLREESGERTTLAVHPQTEVIIDGQPASLEQIQEGSQVRASFDPSGDQSSPGRIEIQTEQGQQQPVEQQPAQQQQPVEQQPQQQQY